MASHTGSAHARCRRRPPKSPPCRSTRRLDAARNGRGRAPRACMRAASSSVQHAGADGVVDVVVDVGDAVGGGHDAALERLRADGAGVVQDAVAHLGGEVEPPPAVLDALHHAQALLVMPVLSAAASGGRRVDAAGGGPGSAPSASSPVWPKGVCPRSWPSEMASARSSFSPSARAMVRAICATSRVWVSRVRK